MPLFMDVHEQLPDGATAFDVAGAHKADLETQDQYGVSYRQYWVDEADGKVSPCRGSNRRSDESAAATAGLLSLLRSEPSGLDVFRTCAGSAAWMASMRRPRPAQMLWQVRHSPHG